MQQITDPNPSWALPRFLFPYVSRYIPLMSKLVQVGIRPHFPVNIWRRIPLRHPGYPSHIPAHTSYATGNRTWYGGAKVKLLTMSRIHTRKFRLKLFREHFQQEVPQRKFDSSWDPYPPRFLFGFSAEALCNMHASKLCADSHVFARSVFSDRKNGKKASDGGRASSFSGGDPIPNCSE